MNNYNDNDNDIMGQNVGEPGSYTKKEIVHIFLGPEERRIQDTLHEYYNNCYTNLHYWITYLKLFNQQCNNCSKDIENIFDKISKQLSNYCYNLIQELNDIKHQQLLNIESDLTKLRCYVLYFKKKK
ncbi:hypothetical protein RFI_24149 [Reticulomyxa filosa]|uniref:Uncharacterized protein n=1 Tax=Reticulomyxa filosa TaxID=46433 RepID=X6MJI5_RETFI|nr:hypothetical protein RFI_24149 [Reticulomyxa filosa]|eukprot:ETO13225.1 hypothetical protein RFI_24149 [Reticulomyxa filosa]